MSNKMADFKELFQQFAKDKNFIPDAMQIALSEKLSFLSDALVHPQKKSWFSKFSLQKGLYIWGGVGRGKTMLMDLFFETVPIENKRRVHFNIFMLDVHNSIKILREDGKGQDPLRAIAIDISKSVKLLCFDEFQIYDIADAMVLSALFKYLFEYGVMVVATGNVDPDNFYKNGLQRSRFLPFIPLFKKNMMIFHLDSQTDYRQQALRDNGVYFVGQKSKLMDLFKKLTSPNHPVQKIIEVQGRTLPIEKFASGSGLISFAELCEKPRAAADYQALAEVCHTVFIYNIPKMKYDRRNEAKRFILLIDTLYDTHTKLVIHAETIPQNIYEGRDHKFEFERTISRLLEMQGEEYLTKTKS